MCDHVQSCIGRENGLPEIVPEEAEIVRLIYRSFMNGMTPYRIAKILTGMGITTPGGKTKWQSSTIESILTNEKYKGFAINVLYLSVPLKRRNSIVE